MKEQTIIKAMEMHDKAINGLRAEFRAMQKVLDKTYVQSLTHVMMWDVLFTLLAEKGMLARDQFDAALKKLSDKTRSAMDAEHEAAIQKKKLETEGKVTVLSDEPAIPVVK